MSKFPETHFFPDVLDISTASAIVKGDDFTSMEKCTFVRNTAMIVPTAHCIRHSALCPLQGPDADGSGSPCWDWSACGKLGRLDGKTVVTFATWARFHVWWGTKMLMHENVPGFFVWFARWHLRTFSVCQFDVSPADSGFPLIERARQYLICVNRTTAEIRSDPYVLFDYVKQQLASQLMPKDAVFAEPAEIRAEEIKICQVRGKEVSIHSLPPDLYYTLSLAEQRYVHHLNTMYMVRTGRRPELDKDLVYNLVDNPENRVSWSVPSGQIPTLRRNSARTYYPSLRRCLTSSERLALMGYPSHWALAAACGSDEIARMSATELSFLVGNAMHMPTATMMWTIGLACVHPKAL